MALSDQTGGKRRAPTVDVISLDSDDDEDTAEKGKRQQIASDRALVLAMLSKDRRLQSGVGPEPLRLREEPAPRPARLLARLPARLPARRPARRPAPARLPAHRPSLKMSLRRWVGLRLEAPPTTISATRAMSLRRA
jgi:hypothetical protein